jgi:hypothetical protein
MSCVITMRELGRYGRWGNQLFQNAFLRCYAARFGIEYQAPEWAGQKIFGLADPPITVTLPRKRERCQHAHLPGFGQHVLPPEPGEFHNHDFLGYAQLHTSWYAPYADNLRTLFTPRPSYLEQLQTGLDRLRNAGDTIIGLQIRRSDYGHDAHYRTPIRWYQDWLTRHMSRFERPVIFVECEDRELYRRFPMRVETSETLGIKFSRDVMPNYADCLHFPPEQRRASPSFVDFFTNWWLLANCHVLLIANSTYGFTAAMFSTCLREAWRSNLPAQTFVPFEPWWDDPGENNSLEQWRGIPDTQVDNNPFCPSIKNKYPAVPGLE